MIFDTTPDITAKLITCESLLDRFYDLAEGCSHRGLGLLGESWHGLV